MNTIDCRTSIRPCCAWLPCLLALGLLLLGARPAPAQNQALKLDGNGSYVELPPNLFKNLTQATVEAWVKWDSLPRYARVFEFGASWQSVSLFNDQSGPDLRFNIYPRNVKLNMSARHSITATNAIRTNEWIHVTAVSGPGGMLLYVNGRLVGQHTNTASFASINTQQSNYLARGMSGAVTDRDFQGQIDEVRVWNQRRTLAQIRDNMFKRLSGREEGLVHLWNFDDGTANDACSDAGHGKLMGHACVVASDLGLVAETVVAAALPPAPAPVPAPPTPPAERNASAPGTAAWWIAGALAALVLLVAWLILMLRRSGVGSGKLVASEPDRALLLAESIKAGQLSLTEQAELKERALAELSDFAKQSLVQGLHSQRAALLEAQKQAQQELVELEARLMSLRVPERIQAYEHRIAELERQLETRGEEFRELTQTTLKFLRQKLEAEKKTELGSRFN